MLAVKNSFEGKPNLLEDLLPISGILVGIIAPLVSKGHPKLQRYYAAENLLDVTANPQSALVFVSNRGSSASFKCALPPAKR